MSDIAKMADDIFDAVKSWVSRALGPLEERLTKVEFDSQETAKYEAELSKFTAIRFEDVKKQIDAIPVGQKGDTGEAGTNGKDAEPVNVAAVIAEVVKQVPAPKDGRDGIDGKDAPAVDVAIIVADVLKQIPVPENGADGKDGRDGLDGKDAPSVDVKAIVTDVLKQIPVPKDGRDADPEFIKVEVAKAVAVIPRPTNGIDGEDGRDGEPGRDAWQIDVLETVDLNRKYQRGTYAKWHGGEIRSFRATDPIVDGDFEKAGWTISREGIAEIALEDGGDLRTFGLRIVMTSGHAVVLQRQMPVVIYRGVFKAEETYARGDSVTWGGSTWIANADAPTKKPGEIGSTEWQLSVKCGRDGKDGLQGKQGETGRAGRDATPLSGARF